jgi:hypothetical protein
MNIGLYRLHRIFFITYMAVIAISALMGITGLLLHNGDAALGLIGLAALPLGLFHYYAAMGSSRGKPWARTMSKVIAWILLIGLPLGTLFAIYIFKQTGRKWQSEGGLKI